MIVIMFAVGGSGYYGLGQLNEKVDYLSGAVAEATSKVTAAVLEVDNQMTAASRLSSGNAKQNDVLDIQNKFWQKLLYFQFAFDKVYPTTVPGLVAPPATKNKRRYEENKTKLKQYEAKLVVIV